MGKHQPSEGRLPSANKPLVSLRGEIKTPPFSAEARQEAGMLLRFVQNRVTLGMPQAEPLPIVGPRCWAIRVPDAEHNWRIMYRIDADAVVIVEVYDKKTKKIPAGVVARCKQRLNLYDKAVKQK